MTEDYRRLNEEIIINHYVWDKFKEYRPEIALKYNFVMPFIPVSDVRAGKLPWKDNPYVVYDSYYSTRSTNKQFYPIKEGRMIYSIKGNIQEIFDWRDFIVNILDRGDQSAYEINNPGLIHYLPDNIRTINPNLPLGQGEGQRYHPDNLRIRTYFHCTSVYQVNSINQSTKQGGVEKDFSTDLIIKYDYHISNLFGEINT
jgi:hypothetical protein